MPCTTRPTSVILRSSSRGALPVTYKGIKPDMLGYQAQGAYQDVVVKIQFSEPVMGVDLSPMLIHQAEAEEDRDPLGITYEVGDATTLDLDRRFDVITANARHFIEAVRHARQATQVGV